MIRRTFAHCTTYGARLYAVCALAILAVLLWAHPALAATRTVDTVADNASLTACTAAANDCSLRGALSGAAANDTINFAPILANQTITLVGGQLVINQPLTLDGSSALTVTVSGNNVSRVISTTRPLTITSLIIANGWVTNTNGGGIYAASNLLLNGSVFSNNVANGLFPNGQGGGAFVRTTATIIGTTFLRNTADDNGGGAYVMGAATITGTTFLSNTALYGGGVRVGGAAKLTGTIFQGNTAGSEGGGVRVTGVATISGASFLSNTANLYGGGALLYDTATLTGTSFQGNTAANYGGGAYFRSSATLTGTSFLNNRAMLGGGAYLYGANTRRMVNVLFARNQASNQGAALYVNNAAPLEILHSTIVSPSLVSNQAIYVQAGTAVLTNTIIANHATAIQRAGGTVREDYSLFAGVTTPFSGTVTAGSHSITGTAAFVDVANDDYQLTASSAAINAGVDAGITSDYFGDLRPQQGGFDIGYDESPFAAPATSLCFTSLDGATTFASSADSQAVQQAVDAAPPGGRVRIAGVCAGVQARSGLTQTVYISKALTLAGGYTTTNWATQAPGANLTILDALASGRVIYAGQPLTVEHLLVQNGVATTNGGGIYASSSLLLVGGQISNSVATGSGSNGNGGGAYVAGSATISGTSFLSNRAGNFANGGGV